MKAATKEDFESGADLLDVSRNHEDVEIFRICMPEAGEYALILPCRHLTITAIRTLLSDLQVL